jgi:tetratricopeptide (TPR) repeat protein
MITSNTLAQSLVQYGILGLQQGYLKAAIKSFTHALQHDPSFVCAIANRAIAHFQLGDEEEALNDLSFALEFSTDNFALYFNRAVLYSRQGNIDGAIADLERAAAIDPQQFISRLNHSMIPVLPNAVSAIRPASSASTAGHVSVARSSFYRHWMQFYLAILDHETATNGENDLSTAINELFQWMLASYAQAIAEDPNNVLLYWDRSWLYGEFQQFQSAIADLDRALELAPTNAVLWSNRGVMHYRTHLTSSGL